MVEHFLLEAHGGFVTACNVNVVKYETTMEIVREQARLEAVDAARCSQCEGVVERLTREDHDTGALGIATAEEDAALIAVINGWSCPTAHLLRTNPPMGGGRR